MAATYQRVDAEGVMEAQDTSKYIGKSAWPCTTCNAPDHFMWIQYQRDEASDLTCPYCGSMRTIPRGTEQTPDRS